jgi:hypothetical protein
MFRFLKPDLRWTTEAWRTGLLAADRCGVGKRLLITGAVVAAWKTERPDRGPFRTLAGGLPEGVLRTSRDLPDTGELPASMSAR